MARRPLLIGALAAALAAGSGPAPGEAPYGFWGFDILALELAEDDGALRGDVRDTSTGVRFHGGYRANDWLGVEAAFQDLGTFRDDDHRFSYVAGTISATLYLPLATPAIDLFARLGGGVARVSDRRGPTRDTKPIGSAGAGLKVHVNPSLALRLGADLYLVEPTLETVDGEAVETRQELLSGYGGVTVKF